MSRRLVQQLKALGRVRALVVGDIVADTYVHGLTERVSREAPVPVIRFEKEECVLGGAANAAANAASLGGRVTMLGLVGKDPMGEEVMRQFAAQGIAFAGFKEASVATSTKTRVLAGGFHLRKQQVLRIDREIEAPLPSALRKRLAQSVLRLGKKADVVLVSDYGAGVIDSEVIASLRALEEAGVPVAIDSRFGLRALHGFTLVKPNEPELELLTGISLKWDEGLRRAGTMALEALRTRHLLVTRGRRGMALFSKDRAMAWLAPHGVREAVDPTGAGDTVHAAVSLGLGAKLDFADAAALANIAGALAVLKPGTATVSAREVAEELGARP